MLINNEGINETIIYVQMRKKYGFQLYWKSVPFIVILIQPYEILSTYRSTKIKDKYLSKSDCSFYLKCTERTFVGMCNRISINNSNRYLWQLNHLQSDVVKKLEENCKIQNFTFIFQVKSEKNYCICFWCHTMS